MAPDLSPADLARFLVATCEASDDAAVPLPDLVARFNRWSAQPGMRCRRMQRTLRRQGYRVMNVKCRGIARASLLGYTLRDGAR